MAPFRRAVRHRPVAQQQQARFEAKRAAQKLRRSAELEYIANLRHFR